MSAGIFSQISFAKETTWGTAVTPNKSIIVRPTGGFENKEDIQLISGIRGALSKNYTAIKGKVDYEGTLTFDFFSDYVGYFLLSTHGVDTATAHSGETVVFDHLFSDNPTKPSLTLEQSITEDVRRFAGTVCKGYKISAKPGEMVQFEANLQAKTFATASQITGAFSTVPSLNHAQVVVKIGGVTMPQVENIEISYTNNQEFVHSLGNVEPAFMSSKGHEASIKMDLFLDSTSLTRLTNYHNNTNESVEVIITGTAIGSAANYQLDYLIPKVAYTTGKVPISDNANLLQIEGSAYFDSATGTLVKPTLTNLINAY